MWAADPALQSYISADRKPSNSAALELNEMRFPSFRMQPTLGETFTRARSNAHPPQVSLAQNIQDASEDDSIAHTALQDSQEDWPSRTGVITFARTP